MSAPLDDLWSDVLFSPDERVGPKVGDAGSGIHEDGLSSSATLKWIVIAHSIRPTRFDSRWCAARFARLLGEVEVGQHDVPALMQEDIWVVVSTRLYMRYHVEYRRTSEEERLNLLSGLRSR